MGNSGKLLSPIVALLLAIGGQSLFSEYAPPVLEQRYIQIQTYTVLGVAWIIAMGVVWIVGWAIALLPPLSPTRNTVQADWKPLLRPGLLILLTLIMSCVVYKLENQYYTNWNMFTTTYNSGHGIKQRIVGPMNNPACIIGSALKAYQKLKDDPDGKRKILFKAAGNPKLVWKDTCLLPHEADLDKRYQMLIFTATLTVTIAIYLVVCLIRETEVIQFLKNRNIRQQETIQEDTMSLVSLVSITSGIVSTIKNLRDLAAGKTNGRVTEDIRAKVDEITKQFEEYHNQLGILADKLDGSETLTRMLPTWQAMADTIPIDKEASGLSSDDVKSLYHSLHSLVQASVRDQFSGAFFRTRFDQLPGIAPQITVFRETLNRVDARIKAVQPHQSDLFVGIWPELKVHIQSLKDDADRIRTTAEEVQGELINELKATAQTGKISS